LVESLKLFDSVGCAKMKFKQAFLRKEIISSL